MADSKSRLLTPEAETASILFHTIHRGPFFPVEIGVEYWVSLQDNILASGYTKTIFDFRRVGIRDDNIEY